MNSHLVSCHSFIQSEITFLLPDFLLGISRESMTFLQYNTKHHFMVLVTLRKMYLLFYRQCAWEHAVLGQCVCVCVSRDLAISNETTAPKSSHSPKLFQEGYSSSNMMSPFFVPPSKIWLIDCFSNMWNCQWAQLQTSGDLEV